MQAFEPPSGDFTDLDPSGLLRGVLGEASASWPVEGPVSWSPPSDAEVATLFTGYNEIHLLGRGGMGAVYAARQAALDRTVAIKLLPSEFSCDPSAIERFRREAHALAKLSHPNIVTIHDFGKTPTGLFFFVMEYVGGPGLHQLIRRGDLSPGDSLDIVRQVCTALEFAHAQGFVHRDIKPSNILLDDLNVVKVTDFGLAMLALENTDDPLSEPTPTMTNGAIGTPEYIAPEQRRGDRPADHRADIYSLGVTLFEMLTGRLPCGAFEPPSRHTQASEEMDRIVIRAMQEDPDKRYQKASDFKRDVCRAALPGGTSSRVKIIAASGAIAVSLVAWAIGNKARTKTLLTDSNELNPPVFKAAPRDDAGLASTYPPSTSPDQWQLDLGREPPGFHGKWWAAGEKYPEAVLASMPLALDPAENEGEAGSTAYHHCIRITDNRGFARITPNTAFRLKLRTLKDTPLQLMVSTTLLSGTFAGNFEARRPPFRQVPNGEWQEIRIQLRDFMPTDERFITITEPAVITTILLGTLSDDAGLEVGGLALENPL